MPGSQSSPWVGHPKAYARRCWVAARHSPATIMACSPNSGGLQSSYPANDDRRRRVEASVHRAWAGEPTRLIEAKQNERASGSRRLRREEVPVIDVNLRVEVPLRVAVELDLRTVAGRT